MASLRRRLAVLAVAGSTVTGCASAAGPNRPHAASATFTDGGVRVELRIVASDPALTATFTPTRPGFHLYSTDLPVGGIDGIGQRTSVDVSGAWVSVGRPRTAARVHDLPYPSLHLMLPVYPDGPLVTSTALVQGAGRTVQVSLSYAACSASLCLPPVQAHKVTLRA